MNAVTRNSPLSGDVALSSSAALVFSESRVTAVTSMTSDNHTVLFAGTADGRMVKVSQILSVSTARTVRTIQAKIHRILVIFAILISAIVSSATATKIVGNDTCEISVSEYSWVLFFV